MSKIAQVMVWVGRMFYWSIVALLAIGTWRLLSVKSETINDFNVKNISSLPVTPYIGNGSRYLALCNRKQAENITIGMTIDLYTKNNYWGDGCWYVNSTRQG